MNEACTSLKKIFLFSKSNKPPTRPLVENGLEEAGGGLIGVDAGRGEQADDAVRFDQTHGTFDEEGVEVDVAAAQKRVLAGTADELAEAVGAQLGGVEFGRQRIALRRAVA